MIVGIFIWLGAIGLIIKNYLEIKEKCSDEPPESFFELF